MWSRLANPLSKSFSGSESHNPPRGNNKPLTSSRISHSPSVAGTDLKRSKTAEHHVPFLCQASLDTVEERLYKNRYCSLWLPRNGRRSRNYIPLTHMNMPFPEGSRVNERSWPFPQKVFRKGG
jgi:hypothetical protein